MFHNTRYNNNILSHIDTGTFRKFDFLKSMSTSTHKSILNLYQWWKFHRCCTNLEDNINLRDAGVRISCKNWSGISGFGYCKTEQGYIAQNGEMLHQPTPSGRAVTRLTHLPWSSGHDFRLSSNTSAGDRGSIPRRRVLFFLHFYHLKTLLNDVFLLFPCWQVEIVRIGGVAMIFGEQRTRDFPERTEQRTVWKIHTIPESTSQPWRQTDQERSRCDRNISWREREHL